MIEKALKITLFAIVLLALTSAASAAAPSDPAAVVSELYRLRKTEKSPFFDEKDRGLIARLLSRELGDLVRKDLRESKDGPGALGFDPVYNGQDFKITRLVVGKAKTKGSTARVPVSFLNFGQRNQQTYVLKRERGSWKIDDIVYSDGSSIKKMMIDYFKLPPQ